jgi:hypothetical protein
MNSLHKPMALPRNITKGPTTPPATGITNEHSILPIRAYTLAKETESKSGKIGGLENGYAV